MTDFIAKLELIKVLRKLKIKTSFIEEVRLMMAIYRHK